MGKTNAALNSWLKKDQQTFTSPQIQNEVLELMANTVLRELAAEADEADYFAVIVGEARATAVVHKEQVSLCVRFLDKKCEAQDCFWAFMRQMKQVQLPWPKSSWTPSSV